MHVRAKSSSLGNFNHYEKKKTYTIKFPNDVQICRCHRCRHVYVGGWGGWLGLENTARTNNCFTNHNLSLQPLGHLYIGSSTDMDYLICHFICVCTHLLFFSQVIVGSQDQAPA